jgi:hypothetical protein
MRQKIRFFSLNISPRIAARLSAGFSRPKPFCLLNSLFTGKFSARGCSTKTY